MTNQIMRAQALSTLPRIAAFIAFLMGAGLWSWITYGMADTNILLWFVGAIVSGGIAAWAVGTWVLVKLL